jgi:hypothetical protein
MDNSHWLPGDWTIIMVSTMYFIWGLLLLLGVNIDDITPIATVLRLEAYPPNLLTVIPKGSIMVTTSILAYTRTIWRGKWDFIWLIPQQIFLLLGALGAVSASFNWHYPDGTFKPGVFIFADQLPMVLLACIYTFVITRHYGTETGQRS